MSKKITLYQALKRSGLFQDKQEINKVVNKGLVKVNGIVNKCLKFQFNPNKNNVTYFEESTSQERIIKDIPKFYFVINKPRQYSCQKGDRYPYVGDLIDIDKDIKNSLFAVGRLDIPTTGVLIITNDGDFGTKLLNPDNKIEKRYWVLVKEKITKEQIEYLESGVIIEVYSGNYLTKPAKVKILNDYEMELTISEGKYRQVRRMLEVVDNRVIALRREAIGSLELRNLNLSESDWKELSDKDIKKLLH
ncbi:rRNA pseudouridine synthase [archaeon]|jgi:16S rRNA pseudouridine516 synthase|nr:rRNA pseudouridine synthase [archaeon]MBT3450321.1 rRNA pseudouridine synthase [archaeon]MBT6869189.1 rRNA pseudouridine synthase [archaeon]MBT7193725.1 rRNA pseudouridine synthase [archaeon]MBT7381372.1 rRNA pseudouridine synthase [archaeon]